MASAPSVIGYVQMGTVFKPRGSEVREKTQGDDVGGGNRAVDISSFLRGTVSTLGEAPKGAGL